MDGTVLPGLQRSVERHLLAFEQLCQALSDTSGLSLYNAVISDDEVAAHGLRLARTYHKSMAVSLCR